MRTSLFAAMALVMAFLAVGCQPQDPNQGMSSEQVKAAETIDSLMAKSGGKWDSLSAEEKDTVMKQWNTTDEATAKRDFERSSNPVPAGGQPGQPGGR